MAGGVSCWAALVSMVSLFGWIMMVRGIQMIPFYGCGFGLACAMMSRIYAMTTPVHPRLKDADTASDLARG